MPFARGNAGSAVSNKLAISFIGVFITISLRYSS